MSRPLRKRRRDVPAHGGGRRARARLIRQEALNRVMGKAVVETVQAMPSKVLCLEHAAQTVQAMPSKVLCLEHAAQNGAWHASAHP